MSVSARRPYLTNVGAAGSLGATNGNHDVGASAALYIAANLNRNSISIYNNGAVTIYVGTAVGVTTATGMPIPAGNERELRYTGAIYAIAASGTQDTRYFEEAT